MGYSFSGILYRSDRKLTPNSFIIDSDGFHGWFCPGRDVKIFPEEVDHLFIDYHTWGGCVCSFEISWADRTVKGLDDEAYYTLGIPILRDYGLTEITDDGGLYLFSREW